MAFTSPISLTLHGASRDLVRINQDNYGSLWRSKYETSGTPVEVLLKISHSKEGKTSAVMERHIVDITVTEYPTGSSPIVYQCYTHIRQPIAGLSATGVELAGSIVGWIDSNEQSLIDWEN
jgi:hypothetical protein